MENEIKPRKLKMELDLTEGNLFKKLFLFSLPIILTNFFQLFYTSMDLVVVANFGGGYNSMTAVGANGALVNLLVTVFVGVGIGVNVVLANARGKNDKEKCDRALHSAILLSIIMGVIIGVVGFFSSNQILKWMHTAESVIDLATVYLKWYFAALPFLMVFNFGSAILRALGDSKRPMIGLVTCGVINIILNLVFVIAFKMDVRGVAVATFISEAIGAILIMCFLIFNKKGYIYFSFKKFRLYYDETKEILKIGIPAGLQSLFFSIANVFLQANANTFGEAVMAGNSASATLEGYEWAFADAICSATTAMVAQNYGAKKVTNMTKTIKYGLIITGVASIIIGVIMSVFARPLLSIFIGQNSGNLKEDIDLAIDKGAERLILVSLTYFTCALMNELASILRGLKHAKTPAIITFITCTLFRLFYIYVIFKNLENKNLFTLYLTLPLSWIFADIMYAYFVPHNYKRDVRRIYYNDLVTREKIKPISKV